MDIGDKQKFIFASIFLLANRLQVTGDKYLEPDGITTKQWLLTVVLSQYIDSPITISDAAALIGSSRQNVKQLALKLEEKELLRLKKDPNDARVTRLVLTDKCYEFWNRRRDKDTQFVTNLFKHFTVEEINIIYNSIIKIVDRLGQSDSFIQVMAEGYDHSESKTTRQEENSR